MEWSSVTRNRLPILLTFEQIRQLLSVLERSEKTAELAKLTELLREALILEGMVK